MPSQHFREGCCTSNVSCGSIIFVVSEAYGYKYTFNLFYIQMFILYQIYDVQFSTCGISYRDGGNTKLATTKGNL
jgi:hypothetical protein